MTFDLQAHRGGAGLWPENTLEAFGRALEQATRVDARIPGVPSTKGLIEK
mgnify:CR=1 FL=1